VQQRLESSAAGRIAISVFLVATLLSVVFWNLPDSELRRKSLPAVRQYILLTSLEQNWGVFAPNPRRETIDLVARVEYADGTEETLRVPRGDAFVGGYWDYRWWKWAEHVVSNEDSHLWHPAAVWFARRASDDGRRPVRVRLVRRWYALLPPGSGPDRGEWNESEYYTLRLTSAPHGEGE
jgi:hypothetical protein